MLSYMPGAHAWRLSMLRASPWMSYIVSAQAKAAIATTLRRITSPNYAAAEESRFVPGQEVEVTAGALQGLRGWIDIHRGDGRWLLRTEDAGWRIEIDERLLREVEPE